VKSKENQSTEEIKKLLKTKIDPVNMKIGIRKFKSLKNGNVLIEADSKKEIERSHSQIRDKCGDKIETYIQKRRTPSLIIYSVPEAVTSENAEDIILAQNPDLKLQEGDIQTKFIFKSIRKTRNIVCNLLGISPASDYWMPTFRNTLSVPSSKAEIKKTQET